MTQSFAILFPGQGSQSVGMLNSLRAQFPQQVEHYFNHAAEILGYDLLKLISEGPAEQLNRTEYTQPAMLLTGYVIWQIWQAQKGLMPSYFAGHSLGEYTALLCANAIGFKDALLLVQKRAQLMQSEVPADIGAMAAIVGLSEEDCAKMCEEQMEGYAAVANLNAIGQTVIAGEKNAVEATVELAKKNGAKIAKLLPVSVPSHCQLMKPAAEKLQEYLNLIPIKTPEIPVLHNVDVKMHSDPEAIKKALITQLYSPVRWVETIQTLRALNINCTVEFGPNKVLQGLIKRIDSEIINLGVYDETTLNQVKQELSQ